MKAPSSTAGAVVSTRAMMRNMNRTLVGACAMLAACAAGGEGMKAGVAKGAIQVVGPRCHEGVCACRRVDEQYQSMEGERDEQPSAGLKRFEIRTGRGLDAMSISVEGRGRLEKSTS